MKTEPRLPGQTKKSIFEYTDKELAEIDKFQTKNRGWDDFGDEDLEQFTDWDYLMGIES